MIARNDDLRGQVAIGYARRSTDMQAGSLEDQESAFRSFCEREGLTYARTIADDAQSGTDLNRPGLRALLGDCENGNGSFSVVLVWDRSRLARPSDRKRGLEIEGRIVSSGKTLICVSDGKKIDDSIVSDVTGLLAYEASFQDVVRYSNATIRGLLAKVKGKGSPGGPVPYGYDKLIASAAGDPIWIIRSEHDGTKTILTPGQEVHKTLRKGKSYKKQDGEFSTLVPSTDRDRVETLREIWQKRAEGCSLKSIRDVLNKRGVPSPKGRRWCTASLNAIFDNPAYVGDLVYNRRTESKIHVITKDGVKRRQEKRGRKEPAPTERRPEEDWVVVRDAFPPLIDRKTFDKVKAMNAANKSRFKPRGRASKSNYVLTGTARCGCCEGNLSGRTTTSGKGYKTRYYTCSTHNNNGGCDKYYQVPADTLEEMALACVADCLKGLLLQKGSGGRRQVKKALTEELTALLDPAPKTESADHQKAELKRKLENLARNMAEMPPEVARNAGLHKEAERLTAELDKLAAEAAKRPAPAPRFTPKDLKSLVRDGMRMLAHLPQALEHGTVEERRELVQLFIQKIEVDPDKKKAVGFFDPAAFVLLMVAGAGFEPTTSGL